MESRGQAKLSLLVGGLFFSAVLLLVFSTGESFRSSRAAAQGVLTSSLYLPSVFRNWPTQTIFGIETQPLSQSGGLDRISATGTTWVRRNAVLWSDVEPVPGQRNWSALVGLEDELKNASSRNLQVILIVRSAPTWAQQIPGLNCGPILPTLYPAFGNFMQDLVARYSALPYNVKYWEIWNEPDVDASSFLANPTSPYGCWGNSNPAAPFYGGDYYGLMLKEVYPRIRAADPQARVLVGGLLLDCDPISGCAAAGHDARPLKFLDGILSVGAGPFFDGVAFHAYDYYKGGQGQYSFSNWNSAWNTTGPTLVAKTAFVKSVLAARGVSGKFLMDTETGLLCDACSGDPVFESTKASYVAQVYAAALANGLRANVWFSLFGWQHSGLLDVAGNPLPAYSAYQFSSRRLAGAQPGREITEYPGVKGYEFDRQGQRVWVIWSLDGISHAITLPGIPQRMFGVTGTPIAVSATPMIGLEPLYLEW